MNHATQVVTILLAALSLSTLILLGASFYKHAGAEAECAELCAPRVGAWAVGHCYCLDAGCWEAPKERALVGTR